MIGPKMCGTQFNICVSDALRQCFDCLILVPRAEFGSRESASSDKQLLTIYDLDNKFIAYSASFDDVIDVVAEWGSFYILTRDGKMFVLQEKDTQTKLEVGGFGSSPH